MPPERSIADALRAARAELAAAGCDSVALDARLLMQHALGLTHAALIAAEQDALPYEAAQRFAALIARRAAREPVSRITGSREFHGRDFSLAADTLDPRPDTEVLVDTALAIAARHWPNGAGLELADLGTGSGAILISLLAELLEARGLGTDVSPGALAAARANAERHGVAHRARFTETDWFPVGESARFGLILSNPPYIESADIAGLAPEVRKYDPRFALDGGLDGLACYRAIAARAPGYLTSGGYLAVETGATQTEAVLALLKAAGLAEPDEFPTIIRDLAGHPRVVLVRKLS